MCYLNVSIKTFVIDKTVTLHKALTDCRAGVYHIGWLWSIRSVEVMFYNWLTVAMTQGQIDQP